MSEPKHTPGPWSVETVSTQVGYCHKILPVRACIYVDGFSNAPKTERLADARLMAAAPEMYAALKKLEASFAEVGCNPHSGICATEEDKGCTCWVGDVRAAVSRAEGRS